jgi:uncharacterized protein YndB with AHSA1/START domain
MAAANFTLHIHAPPSAVFAAITDFDHITAWIPDVKKSYISSSAPVGVGTTFVEEGTFMGRPTQITGIVKEYEPDHRLVYVYETGPVAGNWRYVIHPHEDGSRLEFAFQPTPVGVFKILYPVIQSYTFNLIHKNLESFKAWVETGRG